MKGPVTLVFSTTTTDNHMRFFLKGDVMIKPTDILQDEHRVIQRVLDCLEKMATECRGSGQLDGRAAKAAIDFFRTFADHCHHGKEEVHLFPAMEAKGFSPDCGPTAVMRLEHEQGRAHVRAMDQAVQAASEGDSMAQKQFVEHALAYVTLLRQHIDKEDHCLFAMANQAFSEADQERLLAVFRKAETEEIGPGIHEKYLQLARDLAAQCGLADAPNVEARACCGH